MEQFTELKAFSDETSKTWTHIQKASQITTASINNILGSIGEDKLTSSDEDLVVFGSIARGECSELSDVDWTLLIDSVAKAEHLNMSYLIKQKFKDAGFPEPGSSGMFGNLTISHDLVQHIGGEDDTNHNLTKRLLLLLESKKVTNIDDPSAYERVIRGIIQQYIDNDSSFASDRGQKYKVPRFLLNDVIRFWRTMCVDFAYKQREQKGKKWALRNIKLRTSRKLIFLKGLLMCASCYNNENLELSKVSDHLYKLSNMKPLDVLVYVFKQHEISNNNIIKAVDAYDDFLRILQDNDLRSHLEGLTHQNIYNDERFMQARSVTDKFQNTLNTIFINEDSLLKDFLSSNHKCDTRGQIIAGFKTCDNLVDNANISVAYDKIFTPQYWTKAPVGGLIESRARQVCYCGAA